MEHMPQYERKQVMNPPSLSLEAWWIIALASTSSYLAFMTSMMPTTAYKVRISIAPPAIATMAVITAFLQDLGPAEVMPLYSCVLVGLQLAVVGRKQSMRKFIADTEAHENGADITPKLPVSAHIQMTSACLLAVAVGLWFSYAS
ncbi:hypothetical protein ACIRPK_34345 [Kitasatospora sp. NPDC101801]|uniref:hypothetical protein n=1 Tax=Kitasatospora sp. NPDC101801 TaxID=3364103 RepID=UPI0038025D89